ncbi:MAG: M23 family metallopeptidase [Acidobacteria bacterium]|nr:M23 family metallopeptidase [Acidobacteriota bacterium]
MQIYHFKDLDLARNEYRRSYGFRNFLFVLFFLGVVALAVALIRGGAPAIVIAAMPRAIGAHTPLSVTISSPMGVREAKAYYLQNGRTFPLAEGKTGLTRTWWLGPKQGRELALPLQAGRGDVPGLEDGQAELVIEAWAANLRHSKATLQQTVKVRSTPPRVAAITTQHYVNQGGADMVVYTISPGVAESGVEVAGHLFPGYPLPKAAEGTMFSIFAFPYDAPTDAHFELVARDDAGNEARQTFPIRTFPRKFPARPMNISDDFIQQVVMPIIAHTPEIADQHDPLKNFVLVNRDLRATDTRKLAELSTQSAHEFLWQGAFNRLAAKTEASFADHRFYLYKGEKVDEQFHLGVDLAGTQHMPILAANRGRVILAQYFGIYGNAVIVDHGYGLMSLYGHMNDFAVKPGDTVQQGQLLGHSGATGLAGGDHLHFSMLLSGVQVDPKEWWDPHWIHDRIQAKLEGK